MHTIRLRGPWEISSTTLGQRKVRQPSDWARLPIAAGERLIVGRHFNAPSGLSPGQPVFMTLVSTELPVSLTLNESPVGSVDASDCPLQFEITALLQPRNLLQIELAPDHQRWPGTGDPFELQMEIADAVD